MTPDEQLTNAIQQGDADAAQTAIDSGANVNSMASPDDSMLNAAISGGYETIVERLIDAGVSVDGTDPVDDDMPPLVVASYGETPNAPKIVSLLLRNGADPNVAWLPDTEGETGLTTVLSSCADVDISTAIIRALIDGGADIEKARADGFRPLMLAVTRTDTVCTQLLIDAGADIGATRIGNDDVTAASIAESRGNIENFAVLSAAGAAHPKERDEQELEDAWQRVADAYQNRLASGWTPSSEAATEWYKEYVAKFSKRSTADEGLLAELETKVGSALVGPLLAQWNLMGDGSSGWWEYDLLSVSRSLSSHDLMGKLYDENDWETLAPRELDTSLHQIRPKWWHSGWVPVAEDGGGNLICIDHDPDFAGIRGQVIMWEVHSGPVGPIATSWVSFVQKYANDVESGDWECDDGGIFRN